MKKYFLAMWFMLKVILNYDWKRLFVSLKECGSLLKQLIYRCLAILIFPITLPIFGYLIYSTAMNQIATRKKIKKSDVTYEDFKNWIDTRE